MVNEDWRIQRLEDASERHEKDLYRGNGKPGITTRMEKMEEAVSSIRYYSRWIITLVAGLLIKDIISLVVKR